MSSPAIALEAPDWFSGIATVEEAHKRGARYIPWKVKDHLAAKITGVKRHIRLFCSVLHSHTYDGAGAVSERELAEDLSVTRRMVQYYIVDAEKAGLIKVNRRIGRESVYQFAIDLVVKAGALLAPKPKAEPKPAPPPPSPQQIRDTARKVEDLSSRWYRLLNSGMTPEEARKELGLQADGGAGDQKQKPARAESVSTIREMLSVMANLKSMLPTRAG